MKLVEERPAETLREASVPVLETERLILRAPRREDAKATATLANDRRIAENTRRIPHPYTLADAEQFISATTHSSGEMALAIVAHVGTLVGGCGLSVLDGPAPEIGYWLGVPYWGKGFATEAVRAL